MSPSQDRRAAGLLPPRCHLLPHFGRRRAHLASRRAWLRIQQSREDNVPGDWRVRVSEQDTVTLMTVEINPSSHLVLWCKSQTYPGTFCRPGTSPPAAWRGGQTTSWTELPPSLPKVDRNWRIGQTSDKSLLVVQFDCLTAS